MMLSFVSSSPKRVAWHRLIRLRRYVPNESLIWKETTLDARFLATAVPKARKNLRETDVKKKVNMASRRNQPIVWVPKAYRPAIREEEEEENLDQASVGRGDGRRGDKRRQHERNRNKKIFSKLLPEVKVKTDLYRRSFTEVETTTNSTTSDPTEDTTSPTSTLTTTPDAAAASVDLIGDEGNNISEEIKHTLSNIHECDILIDTTALANSMGAYGSLCGTLQHLSSVGCSLSSSFVTAYDKKKHGNNSNNNLLLAHRYMDISETVLLELLRLSHDRMLLTETARQWKPQQAVEHRRRPSSPDDVSSWLQKVVGKVFSPFSEQQKHSTIAAETTAPIDTTLLQEKERKIDWSTQLIFRNVLSNIARLPELSTEQQGTSTSQRLLNLLDQIPTHWKVERKILAVMMGCLKDMGTRESARKCKILFERYGDPNGDEEISSHFSRVLKAYLITIQKAEETPSSQLELMEEVIEALQNHWKAAPASEKFVDRVLHCSIVLDCMTHLTWGDTPDLCSKAESLVKNALGNQMYTDIQNQIDEDNPDLPSQALRLLNSLALVFAASGQPSRVYRSWKMLDAIMKSSSSSGLTVYPKSDTADRILLALAKHYGTTISQPSSNLDTQSTPNSATDDLDGSEHKNMGSEVIEFSLRLAKYIHQQQQHDKSAGPSYATYEAMLSLIDAVNPPDAAEKMQYVLSLLECHRAANKELRENHPSRPLHHHALRKWHAAAAISPSSTIACVRAARWVEKMEVMSTPILFPDHMLKKTGASYLYDTELRPSFDTYRIVLEACRDTADPKHLDAAADVALKIATKVLQQTKPMKKRQLASIVSNLKDKLPEDSQSKEKFAEFIVSLNVQHGKDGENQVENELEPGEDFEDSNRAKQNEQIMSV